MYGSGRPKPRTRRASVVMHHDEGCNKKKEIGLRIQARPKGSTRCNSMGIEANSSEKVVIVQVICRKSFAKTREKEKCECLLT